MKMNWIWKFWFFVLVGLLSILAGIGFIAGLSWLAVTIPTFGLILKWTGISILGLFYCFAMGLLIVENIKGGSDDE